MMKTNRILQRFFNLIDYCSKYLLNNFLNIISMIFCICLMFYFVSEIKIMDIVPMIISFVISLLTSYFVFSKFKFSNNLFISFMQKFVLLFILFLFISFVAIYFGLIGTIFCCNGDNYQFDVSIKGDIPKKPTDNLLQISANILSKSCENLGAASAGGSAAAAMIKASVNVPPLQRIGLIGGSALITSAGVLFGIRGANEVSKRLKLVDFVGDSIQKSSHGNPDVTRIPSPDLGTNINSPLEIGDMTSPLTGLLDVIFSYNVLELLLIILLIYILFYKFFCNKLIEYIPSKYFNTKLIIEKGININKNFMNIMLGFVIVLLLIFKLLNLFFSYDLSVNIDSYVDIHNFLNTKSLLMTMLFKNKKFYNSNFIFNIDKYNRFITTNNKINYEDYVNLDLQSKIEKFGSYENYLIQLEKDNEVNDEFLQIYYPDLSKDDLFKVFLKELNPVIRTEVKYVLDLYLSINKLNIIKDKLFIYNDYIPKEIMEELLNDLIKTRDSITKVLLKLGYNENDNNIIKLLNNINKNVKMNLIFDKSILNKESLDFLKDKEDYVNFVNFIKRLINKDFRSEESDTLISNDSKLDDRIIEIENILLKIFSLYNFIEDNKIFFTLTKEQWIDKYKKEFIVFSTTDKIERYKIKKGETRTKRMSPRLIYLGYKEILIKMLEELKLIIINDINKTYYNNDELLGINTKQMFKKIDRLDNTIKNDFITIYNNISQSFDIHQFILNISINMDTNNIMKQYNKFNEFIKDTIIDNKTTHDELINIYELINKYNNNYIRISEDKITRENSLSSNSELYVKCREILNSENISIEMKQLMLEKFILNYEKEFTLHLIKNSDPNISNYKLLFRIYKHSTPQFIDRITAFINNNKKRNYELYLKNKDNISKLSDKIALVLFISMDVNQLSNIILSKVIRFIGSTGGITQNELLVNLSDEMLTALKYKINNQIFVDSLPSEEKRIVEEFKENLDDIPFEAKYKFGDLLLELILEEFDYIFIKNNIYENNEHYIYITIKSEYLAILTSSVFNQIKLPMICKPKEWKYIESNDKIKITEVGGYFLDEYNEISKNNKIIRQNNFNKYESIISKNQINSINFLNSRAFEINKDMLEYIIKEWNEEDSILFKGFNKLHPLTESNLDLKSSIKTDILSHNSKYMTYRNIINIALLMTDQTIYFTTFLDFRGRIYPSSHYLSYQSSDLARSLLLFKDISSSIENKGNSLFDTTLKNIMKDDIQSNNKVKNNLLNNIDYFKLYLANTYGKNKLSRNGRIKWVDNNINYILDLFKTDFEQFKNKYLIESKEPFQFLSCIINYYNYLNYNTEIKIPILFDASCSGIQHLSALTTDIKIARLVNLLDNNEPLDFYQYCLDQIINIIKDIPEDGNKKEFKDKILQLKIERKWLKHAIMTIPYNVTNVGISDKTLKYFDKIFIDNKTKDKLELGEIQLSQIILNNKNIEINKVKDILSDNEKKGIYIYIPHKEITASMNTNLYFTIKELYTFATIIKNTVLNIIPPFNQLKFYFDKIIDIMKILDLPIYWSTPSGMTVSMSNKILKSKQIKTSLIKKAKPISILIPTDQIDYKNIKVGYMPNFIHSLDASNIHILIKNIYKVNIPDVNLYTIHDCFASDYKNIGIIELLVKQSFAELYFKQNYLIKIHESFLSQIKMITQIFDEKVLIDNKEVSQYYILKPYINKSTKKEEFEKILIPNLPDYQWSINKNYINNELMFNSYFIS